MRAGVLPLLALALSVGAAQGPRASVFRWPRVKPVRSSYYFPDASGAEVRVAVRSAGGKPLYLLRCEPGYKHPDGSIENFECGLYTASRGRFREDSLLTGDPMGGSVAHTRGEVWASELRGACANYPDWGAVRSFKLRGMELSLELSQVVLAADANPVVGAEKIGLPQEVPTMRSFRMRVSVTEDPGALSAVAEPPSFAAPSTFRGAFFETPPDCGNPVPTHVSGAVTEQYLRESRLGPPFPQVMPVEATFVIEGRPNPTDFQFPDTPIPPRARVVDFPVRAHDGRPAYELECSAYNVPSGSGRIDRYGVVCGLFAAGSELNLLADAVDPYSRMNPAQILPDQLYGRCADYPGWGALRVFRLRGLRLTLRLTSPVFSGGEFSEHALKSVGLTAAVAPDPAAASPVAAPPTYIYWGVAPGPEACSRVLVPPGRPGIAQPRP